MKQKVIRPEKEWVRKGIQVDQGLYQRLATLAAELEITIRSLVNEAFEDLLNKKR